MVSASVGAVSNEHDRPETEAQLRKSLGDAFDKAWLGLIENEANGVMAGVYYISGQIEGSLAKNLPLVPEPAPLESPLQGGQALQ